MLRSKWFQWAVLTAGSVLYLYFAVVMLWGRLSSNDFKHIYLGMKALLDGNSPYPIQSLHHQAALQGYQSISLNPFVYLPFTGYSMAFLAPFDLSEAINAWFIINHLFVIGSIIIMSQIFHNWRIGAAGLLFAALAFNVPLYRTLSAGQLNLALLFLICGGWYLMKKGHQGRAGFIMAFSTLFKLMPGIYGLYFLLRQKWQAGFAMIGSAIFLLILSVFAAGWSITSEFIPILGQMSYGKSTWPHVFSFWDDPPNQSLNSLFSHLFTINDHTEPWINLGQTWANGATWVSTGLLSGFYCFFAWKKKSLSTKTFSREDEATWCATLVLGLLIPSLMWDHYLVMLIFPAAWMFHTGIQMRRFRTSAIVMICYILTSIPWNFEARAWQSGIGIILMSFKLWPTLVIFGLSLCFIKWSIESISEDPHPLIQDFA